MAGEILIWIVGAGAFVWYQWNQPGGKKLIWTAAVIVVWTLFTALTR
jgi:hypothetical protein